MDDMLSALGSNLGPYGRVLVGMLAETPLHPGTGQSNGAVDLPVSRERTTGYPQIPETGLKGALRQWFIEAGEDPRELFGTAELDTDPKAGEVAISTGRLLMLPVRNLCGAYAWATSRNVLERFSRDCCRMFSSSARLTLPAEPGEGKAWSAEVEKKLYLEEFVIDSSKPSGDEMKALQQIICAIKSLLGQSPAAGRVNEQLLILSEKDFQWFCQYGLPVAARNKLDDNKASENLWYEETLPVDSVLYTLLFSRRKGPSENYKKFVTSLSEAYLQVGGNETVGQGWLQMNAVPAHDPANANGKAGGCNVGKG